MFPVGATVVYCYRNGEPLYGVIESGNSRRVMVNIGNGNVLPFSTYSLEFVK